MTKIFGNPIFSLSINTCLVYGAAYLGRTYFKINPLHAALFSLGTLSAHHLCLKLVNSGNNFSQRATVLLVETVTANLAIQCRIFSPLQAIAVIGLTTLCYDAYYAVTSITPWFLPKS